MRTVMIDTTIELEVTVEAEVRLGRPAPASTDPSSTDYGEPGDETEIVSWRVCVGTTDITDQLDQGARVGIEDAIKDEVDYG